MMKQLLLCPLFFALASTSIVACNVDSEDTSALRAEESILSQTFSGKVVDPNGTPIQGARVTINGIIRATSATGQYALSVADSSSGYRIDIRKDGYSPVTELRFAGALNQVHRLTAGTTTIIDPTRPNLVVDQASGIRVNIPANTLRSNAGAPVGTVRFVVIPHTSQTMPGDFTAQNATGARVALISVGAVTLQAFDANNNTLGVAPGATLAVNLPVPASAGGTMPACVLSGACRTAIWRFAPGTALWNEVATAAPAFTTAGTAFGVQGARQGGAIDPADGLGTWNADIEFNTPACVVIEYSNIPLNCYNPTGATPEPGISTTFTQALAGGGTKSKTSDVRSSAAFLVLYNLRPSVDVELNFTFPAGAPANCAGNLTISSTPGPAFGFPIYSATGGDTRVTSGPAWGGTGFPTDGGGAPIDLADVVGGTHPCGSSVVVTTF